MTNGRASFISGEDERGPLARRWRDILRALVSDAGGEEMISTARTSLIRKASTIIVRLEVMESRLIIGDESASLDDLEAFARISSQLRRLLETLGLERVAKDATPTLSAIVQKHKATERPQGEQNLAHPATVAATSEKRASAARSEPALIKEASSEVTGAEQSLSRAEQSVSQPCETSEPGASPDSAPENRAIDAGACPLTAEVAA